MNIIKRYKSRQRSYSNRSFSIGRILLSRKKVPEVEVPLTERISDINNTTCHSIERKSIL
jgi:hypothetical protein